MSSVRHSGTGINQNEPRRQDITDLHEVQATMKPLQILLLSRRLVTLGLGFSQSMEPDYYY